MKISKYLLIDSKIRLKKFYLSQLKRNYCKKDFYLLCTPTYENYMFEIIKSRHLNEKYEECYLIGIAEDYETILDYLKEMVDKLYNSKTLDYKEIKA